MGVFIAGLLGAVVWAQNKIHDQEVKYDESISGVLQRKQLKKLIGGDWSLIDMHGKPITHTDLEGSYYLIYFGFTKCPDICPATLIKLSRVLRIIRKLPENHYINLKIVFISCDPDRDTPQRLREYLKNFDDEIVGVTASSNNDPELLNVMKSFKIYTNRIDLPNGDYTMDHTTITYLMD
jgi:protein SCO1